MDKTIITAQVPCGKCTMCCQRDMTFIHPELGDDPDLYKTEEVSIKGKKQLQLLHSKNGDCIYLDRQTGCTIYDHRPAMCRELDCRLLLNSTGKQRKQLIRDRVLNKKLLQAARECQKRTKNKIGGM